jgi:hypothetical protein
LAGQADRAQRLVGEGQQRLGLDIVLECGEQPSVDGTRGRTGELLIDDRLDESSERRPGTPADADRPGRGDQSGQDRVARRQDVGRPLMGHPRRGPDLGRSGHPVTLTRNFPRAA